MPYCLWISEALPPLSEALQPEQVVEILNEYLSWVTDAIFKNGGTLRIKHWIETGARIRFMVHFWILQSIPATDSSGKPVTRGFVKPVRFA